MYKNCYGICFTPQTYNAYKDWWSYFKDNKDTFIILDNSKNIEIDYDAFQYTEDDIRRNFNFHHPVSTGHYWNSYGNRNIVWFFAYLRMINFYLSHPNYDYYWFFDDDVYCENWELFLKGFENDDSDFLSYYLFKNVDVEEYPNIPKMDGNSHSGPLWFNRFPGHTDTLKDDSKKYFGSFFAIVRYSKKAMEELIKLTNEGYFGYGEGFVPTSFSKLNLKMNTIFKNDNTSDYFDDSIVNVKHKNTKITWQWI
jgi:hypothetical protein